MIHVAHPNFASWSKVDSQSLFCCLIGRKKANIFPFAFNHVPLPPPLTCLHIPHEWKAKVQNPMVDKNEMLLTTCSLYTSYMHPNIFKWYLCTLLGVGNVQHTYIWFTKNFFVNFVYLILKSFGFWLPIITQVCQAKNNNTWYT